MRPYFVFVYHVLFMALSMLVLLLMEGFGRELFVNALYFNLYYLIIGGFLDFIWFLLLRFIIIRNINSLQVFHFIACLLVMNLFSFYFDSSWLSWSLLSGVLGIGDGIDLVSLCIHAYMAGCYYLAVFVTNKWSKIYSD